MTRKPEMSLLLLNPPVSRYDSAEISPPLSLLNLAQAARRRGIETSLLDLNLPPHREMADYPDLYYNYVLELVALSGAREVGITSMGVNSHLAISLANLIYEHLGVPVVLGGIHLSSISDAVRSLCPTLSCLATPSLRDSPEKRDRWWASDQSRVKGCDAAVGIFDLFSAVDLDLYFSSNPRRVANLETGSGCKYNCSFCYSPTVHPAWFNKSTDDILSSFDALRDLGFTHVFLVQDNLLNDSVWLETLARKLSSSNSALPWNGYATLPDLKPSMLPLLAEAKCRNLYIGIDSVDQAQQKSWNKRFLRDGVTIQELVRLGVDAGVTLTCAFIIDPDPSAEAATFSALDLALRLRSMGAEIRLSVLTPYPSTKFFCSESLVYSEERTAVLMDLPEVVVRNPYAPLFVDAFPWHSRPSIASHWQEFLLAVNAAQTIISSDDKGESSILELSGEKFWRHCQDIVEQVSLIDEVHKTELGEILSLASLSLRATERRQPNAS
ncbi:MAG: radical SAM protein [Thermoanaerobaculia bacterium]